MAKTFQNVTHIQKHDTEANWNLAKNFHPAKGQLIIYDEDETHDYVRMKVGDGEKTVGELDFVDKNTITQINNVATEVRTKMPQPQTWADLLDPSSASEDVGGKLQFVGAYNFQDLDMVGNGTESGKKGYALINLPNIYKEIIVCVAVTHNMLDKNSSGTVNSRSLSIKALGSLNGFAANIGEILTSITSEENAAHYTRFRFQRTRGLWFLERMQKPVTNMGNNSLIQTNQSAWGFAREMPVPSAQGGTFYRADLLGENEGIVALELSSTMPYYNGARQNYIGTIAVYGVVDNTYIAPTDSYNIYVDNQLAGNFMVGTSVFIGDNPEESMIPYWASYFTWDEDPDSGDSGTNISRNNIKYYSVFTNSYGNASQVYFVMPANDVYLVGI